MLLIVQRSPCVVSSSYWPRVVGCSVETKRTPSLLQYAARFVVTETLAGEDVPAATGCGRRLQSL